LEDNEGSSPLNLAVFQATSITMSADSTESIKRLIKRGANVNHPNGNSMFPLLQSHNTPQEVIQLLIDSKADLNQQIQPIPVYKVIRFVFPLLGKVTTVDQIAEKCLSNGDGCTALHFHAWMGNYPGVRLMLKARADPTIRTNTGKTALEFAKMFDVPEEVEKALAEAS